MMRVCRNVMSCVAGCLVLWGCNDGLLHEPAGIRPAQVALSYSLLENAGGTVEAYGSVNVLSLRFTSGDDVRFERTFPFDASAAEVRLAVDVPLRELTETLQLELELRLDASALFRSSGPVTLTAGQAAAVELPLAPVVSSVTCSGPAVSLDAVGATAQVTAAALFATGDTVPDHPITWSSTNPQIVAVDNGTVSAVGDGSASVMCFADGSSDARAVNVLVVITSIEVSPPTAGVVLGGTQQFTALPRDRLNNVIGRVVTWTSAAPGVATVNSSGLATTQSVGSARIDATFGGVTGSATLTVLQPPPVVVTTGSSQIAAASALLSGTVNPRGAATTAWFEYGTSPTLATFATSLTRAVGSGTAPVAMDTTVRSLAPLTTYYFRMAASNSGGTARGPILSFTTAGPPSVRTVSARNAPTGLEMNGAANPNGAATSVYFEWSFSDPTLSQPFITPVPPMSIGAGRTEVAFTWTQTDDPGRGAYVRAVATNQFGTSRGAVIQVPPTLIIR